jgi:shikimate dehydrogenase
MPLKRRALQLAGSASGQASAIGAANTLLATPHGWRAENTDWLGVRDSLASSGIPATGRVLLLGAGGTAQAALAALTGAASVTVLVREPARAAELAGAADRLDVRLSLDRLDPATWPGLLAEAELVISTLPPGAADPLAGAGWRPGQALLDVVYRPWPTALAAAALVGSATVVSGARMLLWQACGQVELMTGRAAPVEAMRAALLAAVPDCGA